MNDYGMTIIAGGREIEIPVLPQKLKVTSPGNNDKATVLVLGDILILRKKGLRTVAWDSFFPVNDAPFVTGRRTGRLLLFDQTVGMEGLFAAPDRPSTGAEETGTGQRTEATRETPGRRREDVHREGR